MSKKENKKKNSILTKIVGIVILIASVLIMAYPFVSEWLFQNRQDSLIQTYRDDTEKMEDTSLKEEIEKVKEYNHNIFVNKIKLQDPFKADNEELSEDNYKSLLNTYGNGIMGYISIPCIKVELPIYHGTSDSVLQNGIGHLEGTSLPVGGESTHSVLTGHTGLNRARLFTDLTEVEEGDVFFLYVLNEKLAYEVDQVSVVEPYEIENLVIENGKDYCTLITCTPYGINTHRLFVRGHRVEYKEEIVEQEVEKQEVKGTSNWMTQYKKAMILGVSIVVGMVLVSEIVDGIRKYCNKKKQRKGGDSDAEKD